MANDASMIFRIKGDASHVKRELATLGVSASRTVGTLGRGVTGALQGNFSALSGGISAVTGGLSMLGPKGMIAAAAIGAVAGAASAAAGSIFALTKEAAAYAGTIMDAMEKTGLGAETLTALDYAAKISASSIEEVTKATTRFSKTIGEAAEGSKEAQDKLASLGINPQEALNDLNGALSKVFRRIMSLPPGVQRTKAAMDAFGKSGANLLPMLNTLDGDLEGFIEKAREVGMVMDDQTVIALDAFDENLQRIQAQFGGLTRQIGAAFLPMFMEMATEVSNFLKENQDEIKQIAKDASGVFRGIVAGLKTIVDFLRENEWAWTLIKNLPTLGRLAADVLSAGRAFNQMQPPTVAPTTTTSPTGGNIDDLYKQIDDEQRALKERRQALDAYYKMETEEARVNYEEGLKIRLDALRNGNETEAQFRRAYSAATTKFYDFLRAKVRAAAELQLQEEGLTAEKSILIRKRLNLDIDALNREEREARVKALEQINAIEKGKIQERIDAVNREYEARLRSAQVSIQQAKAFAELGLARGTISERQAMAQVFRAEIAALDLLIEQTRALMAVEGLSHEERVKYAAELALLQTQRQIKDAEIETAGIEGDRRRHEAGRAQTIESLNLQMQIKDIEEQRDAAAADARIREIQAEIQKNGTKKALIAEIAEIERIAEERRNQYAIARLELERQIALANITGKEDEEQRKFEIEELYRQKRLLAEEEFQRRLKEIKERAGQPGAELQGFQKTVESFKDAVKNAFVNIAQGIGSAVQAWVLYGETGGAVVRKVVAESLAALAQQATVQAIIEAAKGFGRLAVGDGAGAAKHFKSAALWGAGAVAAGVAGRVVAGDTFKKESGRESVSGRTSSSSSSGQGKSYSSMQDQTVDVNRAASFGAIQRETVVVVKDKSGMFSKLFQVEMEKNSKVRQTILRTA